MLMHDSTIVLGGIAAIAAVGLVARTLINTVARNLLRIKAASATPLPAAQEQRMAQMEGEIASLREEVSRLSAVESFYAQLQAPPGGEVPATQAAARGARPVNPPGVK